MTAAARPRDAQRLRVYRAETPVPASPLPGLDACGAYAERVVGTLWWHARFPHRTIAAVPRLRPGNGARQAFFREEDGGQYSITLPRRYRTKGVVLHELAHWALWDEHDLAHHGETFTRVLLDATTEFCGQERADALAASFVEHRVRVGDPARVAPDGELHYGCDERIRRGRDQQLTVHYADRGAPTRITAVLSGLERSGSTVVLHDGTSTIRVATRAIFDVHPPR
jgi:putative metallohydrolase (TIGR04338 family)